MLDNVDLTKNQFLNAVFQTLAGNHASPVEAIVWYDSTAKRVKTYDGAAIRSFAFTDEIAGSDADTLDGQEGVYYLDRSNHTGAQLAATISDFETAVNAILSGGGYATQVDIDAAIAALVDSAPGTLDTLNEIAAALQDNPDVIQDILDALALRTRKFATTIGDGGATAIAVPHNLNTTDVTVSVYRVAAPGEQVFASVERTDANTINIRTAEPVAPNSLRVVIVG